MLGLAREGSPLSSAEITALPGQWGAGPIQQSPHISTHGSAPGNGHQYSSQLQQDHRSQHAYQQHLGPGCLRTALLQTWKSSPTLHYRSGRAGFAPHLMVGWFLGPWMTNSATTCTQSVLLPKTLQGFELTLSSIYLSYDLLDEVKGLFLQVHCCRTSMTHCNSRIYVRGIGEGPVLTVYQRPWNWSTTHSTMNIWK